LIPESASDVVEHESDERDLAAVTIDVFSFLNGRAKVFAPCFTDFFREAALAESVEDFVDEVSVDLAMSKVIMAYLVIARRRPFYSPSDPILNLLPFFQVAAAAARRLL
jgi:hypothetical protein